MAEYSQEYNQTKGIEEPGDFSLREIFHGLKPNSSYITICEGFGIVTIIDKNFECYIKFEDGREISFKELIGIELNKKEPLQKIIHSFYNRFFKKEKFTHK